MQRLYLKQRLPLVGIMIAGGFSRLGNSIAGLALPWFVLTLTNSAGWTSAAAAAGLIPLIFGAVLGGTLITKFGARNIAIASDLVGAFSVAGFICLHVQGDLGLSLMLVLIALGAFLDGPGITAQETQYPELSRLARLKLVTVAAADELIDNGTIIVGPVMAGLIIATSGEVSALILTACCLLIAAVLNAISMPRSRKPAKSTRGLATNDLKTGIAFIFSCKPLLSLLLLGMVVLAIFGTMDAVIMPVYMRENGLGVSILGWFLASAGCGAVVGALAYAWRGASGSQRTILLCCLALEALAFVLISSNLDVALLLIAGGVAGLGAGPLGPMISTYLLRETPKAIRSHVLGVSVALSLVASPLAVLLAGALLETLGTQTSMWILSVSLIILAICAALMPSLRKLDER
jgi:macrolide resistance protein